jgi:hypothetical protein
LKSIEKESNHEYCYHRFDFEKAQWFVIKTTVASHYSFLQEYQSTQHSNFGGNCAIDLIATDHTFPEKEISKKFVVSCNSIHGDNGKIEKTWHSFNMKKKLIETQSITYKFVN